MSSLTPVNVRDSKSQHRDLSSEIFRKKPAGKLAVLFGGVSLADRSGAQLFLELLGVGLRHKPESWRHLFATQTALPQKSPDVAAVAACQLAGLSHRDHAVDHTQPPNFCKISPGEAFAVAGAWVKKSYGTRTIPRLP